MSEDKEWCRLVALFLFASFGAMVVLFIKLLDMFGYLNHGQ